MISQTRPSLGESSGEKEEMSLEIVIGQLCFYGEEGRNAPPRGRVRKMYRVAARKTRSNDGRLSAKDEKICEIFGVPLAKFAGRFIIVFAPTWSARLFFLPDWRNRQTRWIQNPLPARASRFDSGVRYFKAQRSRWALFLSCAACPLIL